MTDLSPAAQAVDDAFWKTIDDRWNIYDRRRAQLAAAIRALAERIHGADAIRQDILDIADELENQ